MKEFYGHMVCRWLAAEDWDQWEMSPLEAVVEQECRTEEASRQVHDHVFELMLKKIARMEEEAAEYGGGEQDWMVSSFHRILEEARAAEESSREELTPRRHRTLEYRPAAMVYPLRRQGKSPAETAAELGMTEEAVREAERKLIRLFRKQTASAGCHLPASLQDARTRTLLALEKGSYRLFRRETETGIQYRFYCRDRLIGTGSGGSASGGSLVLRQGALIFSSSFGPDITVFPGLSRTLVDADEPVLEAARLAWLEKDRYELRLNWDSEPMTVGVEGLRFYRNDRKIGEILPLEQPQKMDDWEIGFCMEPCEPLSDETALTLMSFPLLRFDL